MKRIYQHPHIFWIQQFADIEQNLKWMKISLDFMNECFLTGSDGRKAMKDAKDISLRGK